MISTAFRIQKLKVELTKNCSLTLSYCPEKNCKNVFGKIGLGIDLAMAEGTSVILAGDYNLHYFAKLDRSQLQSATIIISI